MTERKVTADRRWIPEEGFPFTPQAHGAGAWRNCDIALDQHRTRNLLSEIILLNIIISSNAFSIFGNKICDFFFLDTAVQNLDIVFKDLATFFINRRRCCSLVIMF